MALLAVARMGNPVLRRVAEPVSPEELGSPAFQQFCDDLLASMRYHDGVGLAAPQVHVSKRVVVIAPEGEPMFLINPRITPRGEGKATGYEGCLSLPGLRGRVERWTHIRVDAVDREGTRYAFEAYDWAARIVQHECDHLDAVLYIDRATPGSMTFLDEYRRYGPPIPADDEDEESDEESDEPGEAAGDEAGVAPEGDEEGSDPYTEAGGESGSGEGGGG